MTNLTQLEKRQEASLISYNRSIHAMFKEFYIPVINELSDEVFADFKCRKNVNPNATFMDIKRFAAQISFPFKYGDQPVVHMLKEQIIIFRDFILNNAEGTKVNLFHRGPKVELMYSHVKNVEDIESENEEANIRCFTFKEGANFPSKSGMYIGLTIYRL